MAKEILDIYIEQNYPYEFSLDFNDSYGADLEGDYACTFYCQSIGEKTFSVADGFYFLKLDATETNSIASNLEEYVVYVTNNTTLDKDKLVSGRIILDGKVG